MTSSGVSQSGAIIKKVPSKLIEDQISGRSLADIHRTPEIVQFLNISDYSIYPNTEVPLDEPLFFPEPTVIQFSNYQPLDTKEAVLRLRNKDKVSRRVKIIPPDSRLFSLHKPVTEGGTTGTIGTIGTTGTTGTKVAPGMTTEYVIHFTPEAKVDYSYDLTVVTEREKFLVPVRCLGQRAMVSFPDVVHFGVCPVKYASERPVLIRNVGEKPTKWVVKVQAPFRCSKAEGYLEVDQVDQLIMSVTPIESRVYDEEVELNYDNLVAYIRVVAEGRNDPNIQLSKSFLDLKKAYITLSSQDNLKIINKSEVPVEFEWRAFASESEENEKKQKLLLQLSQEEAEERMLIEENLEQEQEVESLDSDDSYDELETKNLKEKRLQRALAALERKYANISKAVEDDFMLFQDDIFLIEPQSGKIWPGSELEITVTFCPQDAVHYTCTAYCNVTCSEGRLPLTLEAIGIGPQATLSLTEYDIGDVFVNDLREVPHVYIENQGEIEAKFRILPSHTPFGSKFQFESLEGTLGTSEYNKAQPVKIKFCSDLMGEFSETFHILLAGSVDELTLTLKGHVMPPSFRFDKDEINFLDVSYQFPYNDIVRLKNTSRVPFTYHIRIPGDSSTMKKEFDIIPKSGYLKPNKTHNIQLDFMPMTVKKYDLVMVVDIEGVGPDMHTLPIKAECFVPKVELIPADSMDFGPVFLRHPYEHELELKNRSRLQAKFEMLTQDEQSTLIAKYTPDREEGFIDIKSSAIVKVTLVPQKAGPIRIPMYVKVLGESTQPSMITLLAQCTGPIVQVLTPELDFGKVKVLDEYRLPITLHNKSDIDAEYTAFTKNKNSVFKVIEKSGTLEPEETRQITVLCCADEAIAFNEVLHIVIKEGTDVDVALKARGTGTTAYCEHDIKVIDFGTVFTCRNHVKRFTIQNRGRKQQRIKWNRLNNRGALVPVTEAPGKQALSAEAIRRSSPTNPERPDEFVFAVAPVAILLQPKTQLTFEFIANSQSAGDISEPLFCTSLVGSERKEKTIFECSLQGQFIEPLLQFSESLLYFKYVWEQSEPMHCLVKELCMSCVSLLPTSFTLKCSPPFSISKEEINLSPGESDKVLVEFDPGHKYDRVSGKATQKLQLVHVHHPQRDSIDLIGEVCFPNLKLETSVIDFGCILNDTAKKVYIQMENNSILQVQYQWAFVEEVYVDEDRASAEASAVDTDINQFFDILPIMGTLGPGESEVVEFIYHSRAGEAHQALAVCAVAGGPEYEVSLIGESSHLDYALSKYSLDFGDVAFNESAPLEFYIENTAKVPFEFSIGLESLSRPGVVDISPSRGKVAAKEKGKITVKVTPGVPDQVLETVVVAVAHFDPVLFQIRANGIYPALLFHLPRPERAKFNEALDTLKAQRGQQSADATSVHSKIENLSKAGRALRFDQNTVEIESEADRICTCRELARVIDEHFARFSKRKSVASNVLSEDGRGLSALLNECSAFLLAGVWECNFGNMVLGKDKARFIRMSNVGQLPISFNFDVKALKFNGLSVEPAKVQKLLPGESMHFTVKFQSNKKTMNFGPMKTTTTIQVKGGLSYQLLFRANLTTPDFCLSSEALDFGRVLLGTLAVAKVRIENTREVPCEWSFSTRVAATAVTAGKDWERFQVLPGSGVLAAGQKAVLDVIFTPTQEKAVLQKLEFKIVNNPTNKVLTAKGQGTSHSLEFVPGVLILGPVLPYKHDAYSLVELKNPTDYAIELYSVDFDSQYKEEEEVLKQYEAFEGADDLTLSILTTSNNPQKPAKALHFPPRKPGAPLWKEVTNAHLNRRRRAQRAKVDREMTAKLSSEDPEERAEAEQHFQDKQEEPEGAAEESFPQFIPHSNRHNVIVWGRPESGKTFLAHHLAAAQGRLALTLNDAVQWHLDEGTALASHLTSALTELQEKREKALQEREKARKTRKKKDEEGAFDEKLFKRLPEDLLEAAFAERLACADCNAGVVFDDLECDYCATPQEALQVLSRALQGQSLQLLLIDQGASSNPAEEEEEDLLVLNPTPDERALELYQTHKQHTVQFVLDLIADKDSAPEDTELGPRLVNEVSVSASKSVLLRTAFEVVPAPLFPDPDSLPLPPPSTLQIVTRPKNRPKRQSVKVFSILTPIDQRPQAEDTQRPASRPIATPKGSALPQAKYQVPSSGPGLDLSEENLDSFKTRWVVGPKSSVYILVKFWAQEIGHYEKSLSFEIVGCPRPFVLQASCECAFPSVNSDPRNVFMKRRKQRPKDPPESYVARHFIATENKFEFGPLLLGKTAERKDEESVKRTNSEVFRMTNNGAYPLEVEFALKSLFSDKKSVFVFEPEHMRLDVDETKELMVWAFPDSIGEFADAVVGLVQGTPRAAVFPVACQGDRPTAEVDSELISFERILLGQKFTKTLTISNVCKLPLKWALLGLKEPPEEFLLGATSGVLRPTESVPVQITFSSEKQQKFSQKLTLEVRDVEDAGVKQESKAILLEAEAFDVKIHVNFFNEASVVDFKDLRVFEEGTQQLAITNQGIYEIKFHFLMKKKLTREMLNFAPLQGTLSPGQTQNATVTFKSDRERKIDPCKDASDIKLVALEGGTGEKFEEIPINVAVNVVFTKYSIHPLRNINFGPLQYGDSRNRTFEIRNEGIFDFEFRILDFHTPRAPSAEHETPRSAQREEAKNRGKKPEKKPTKGKELVSSTEIGPFTVAPSSGTVPRHSALVVNLTFNADGDKLYQKTLAVDIVNRDPKDSPQGIPYELMGESCIPGLNTWDFDMIFEEQTVVPSLALVHAQKIISSKVFAQEENLFLFGTQLASKTHPGIVEKFKIINCSKVPANVAFSVKPRTSSKSEAFAFEVAPHKTHIKSHGHEYVSVLFRPTDITAYGGLFEALVEHGDPSSKTHKLVFELRGEGTLPTVTQVAASLAEDGKSLVKFPRTSVGSSAKASIVLMNGGLLPATVTLELEYHRSFRLEGATSVTVQPKARVSFDLVFAPEDAVKYAHELKMATLSNPYETQFFSLQAEGYREDIMLEGLPEGHSDNCVFGDCIVGIARTVCFSMKNHSERTVKFEWPEKPHFTFVPSVGHLLPKQSKQIKVQFKADEPIQYTGAEFPCALVQINRSDPRTDWDNSMSFTTLVTPKQYEKLLKQKEEDERRRKEEAEAAAKKGAKKPPPKKKEEKKAPEDESEDDGTAEIEVQETLREPEHSEIEKTQKQVNFKCAGVADYLRYSCDYTAIRFAPTLMLATRSFKFPLRNASTITMPYKFKICSANTGKLDAGPYSVAPREGTIAPGCHEIVTVKFLPAEVDELNERLLVCSLQHLAPELDPLVLELKGRSTRPVCHFELDPSNYREKRAQDVLQIDENFEIIEFESLGTKVRNTRRFYVVNPTSQAYEFVWSAVEKPGSEYALKQFKCLTSKGVILSGKKFEMLFEYTPETVGTHESFWKFLIPSERVAQNFFVVGSVLEPVVFLNKGMIDFHQLLVGGKAKEEILISNQEHIPFSFVVDKDTVKGEEDYGDSLAVHPTTGVVGALATFKLEVTFKPKKETRYNYNVTLKVKKKARGLALNVKGIGYLISHSVFYENSQAPLLKDQSCEVNFGEIFVNETQSRTVHIMNSGKFNFDFSWKKHNSLGFLTITPEQATVRTGETLLIQLKYSPLSESTLENSKLTLSIVSGPKYIFECKGRARKPGVSFSFTEYDFGPCFVLRTLMPQTANLEITNYDNSAISVETDFEKKPHLDVQLAPGQVLLPTTPKDPELHKKKLFVAFVFTPRDVTTYSETITFDINGLHRIKVLVRGEGCPIRLELLDQEQETVDFGVLRASEEKVQTVSLTNRSKRAVRFSLVDSGENMREHFVAFSPDRELELKAKQVLPIEFWFKPTGRLYPFSDDLLLKFTNGETKKLLTVKGACYGIELKLMEEVVSFGAVVQGSHQSKYVQLLNIGDIPCAFAWDSAAYKHAFTILPESGFLAANSELYFEVTFHPKQVYGELTITGILCNIQGADPLHLTVIGTSIEPPAEFSKELKFETIVREAQNLKVQVKNTSAFDWRLSPSISTSAELTKNYWTGPTALDVRANGTADYEIAYAPLTMVGETPHRGTLFFPLPDGTANVYHLLGFARPPKPSDVIVKEIKAKAAQIVTLPVKNWLERSQRFEVNWSIEGESDPAVVIRGANTIEIPGYAEKGYKLNFITYKLATTKFRITFTNPVSKEYLFFTVEMKATAQDSQGSAELSATVRETASRIIMIANPLDDFVRVDGANIQIESEYVLFTPDSLEIPPHSESGLELTYRPLTTTSSTAKLTVRTKELGDFTYSLELSGLPYSSHRNLHFTAALGTELVQAFRFQHYCKKAIQYTVKIERVGGHGPPDFRVDKPTVDAPATGSWDGTELTIPLIFEPSSIGESRAMVTLAHTEGGEYSCLLYGHSSPPMPQGPFKCLAGKGANVEFKNPFTEAAEFHIKIDNPSFTVSTKSPVRLEAKKSTSVQVTYKFNEGRPSTGRMLIIYGDLPPWVYYLAGE